MKWIAPTEFDKSILLIICMLTIFVGGSATIAGHLGLISDERAFQIDLMAIGWFIGAIMVYLYERWKNR